MCLMPRRISVNKRNNRFCSVMYSYCVHRVALDVIKLLVYETDFRLVAAFSSVLVIVTFLQIEMGL